tara:strand:- start:18 stop:974 length:957 start_codon:yes stop_codon:yes gene_type:complete
MNVKCSLCNQITISRNQNVRSGETLKINYCNECDFEFFSHDQQKDLENNKLDISRLESAGLTIPNIEEDYQNGLLQSRKYMAEYLDKEDVGKNILEVGCSWGYFLELTKKFGCNSYGVEINKKRSEYINQNLNIRCDLDINKYKLEKIKFKKIFLFYVLEYIPNPIKYIDDLINMLEESGQLIIITPNLKDILKNIFMNRKFNNFFYDIFAINYFSPKSIQILSNKINSNFNRYETKTIQGYSYANHINWFLNNKPTETKIVGGDRFISDIILKLKDNNNDSALRDKLINFFEKSKAEYEKIISDSDYGNQILLKFKK